MARRGEDSEASLEPAVWEPQPTTAGSERLPMTALTTDDGAEAGCAFSKTAGSERGVCFRNVSGARGSRIQLAELVDRSGTKVPIVANTRGGAARGGSGPKEFSCLKGTETLIWTPERGVP